MTRTKAKSEENIYALRRKRILKLIRGEAAVFFTSPEHTASRDQHFPYQPDSDFLYLTGFSEPEAALVLLGNSSGPRSVLFLRERDPQSETWHGERLGLKRAKRRIDVDEVRDIRHFKKDLPELIAPARILHFSPGVNASYDSFLWQLFQTPVGPRLNFPSMFKDARLMTSEMRFVKDKSEIHALRHASDITARAFLMLMPRLREVSSERHAAQLLQSYFSKLGAHGLAFPTIVASGRNATTLHHRPELQPLWQRELVLIDAGASFRGYAGDITRSFPVSGKFTKAQAEVYDVVHSAVNAALSKALPDSCLQDIHEAAVKHLVLGLVDLRILKGTPSDNIEKETYRRYYMHRTSHFLGLDVHDIAPISVHATPHVSIPPQLRPLLPGVALTIEPGLYFHPDDTSVPAAFRGIGIRLEQDVLITNNQPEVLSAKVPLAREDIEKLMA